MDITRESCTDIPERQLTKLFSEYPEARDGFNQAKKGHSSQFTLLAACGKRERAHENVSNGVYRGNFTDALINALDTQSDQLSYAALHKKLDKLPFQNPEFIGATNRVIFTLREAEDDGSSRYFDISSREDGFYTVKKAGIALGIGRGTRFKVLTLDSQVLGALIVENVETFQCHARAEFQGAHHGSFPDGARAVLHDWSPCDGPLRVALGDGVKLPQETSASVTRFEVVEPLNADIIASVREGNLEIQREDDFIPVETGIRDVTFPNKTDPRSIESVLVGIAHFNHHLFRQSHGFLGETVSVELYRLKKGTDGRFLPEDPDKPANLLVDNRVHIPAFPQKPYGMLIKNSSQYALYPYLFYFNPSRYSIVVRILFTRLTPVLTFPSLTSQSICLRTLPTLRYLWRVTSISGTGLVQTGLFRSPCWTGGPTWDSSGCS